ncbi:hypothetical protein B0H16DRAFT_1543360 [Mycena metata]|uniref:Uncharacterized protein n=1 Tax=Mycena metata TaxID=1033252 RepID=A0AAD7IZS6_9AGAR|nr:hypothetical protein B0H16DRAFT_1543360 [Mycena metata]
MHPYGTNPNNPALFRAPFLLIIESKLILFVILIALGVWQEEHRVVDVVFVFTFLAYFATVHYALMLACIEKLHLFAVNSLFPWVVYSWKDGASQVSVCQTNIDTYLKHRMHPNWEEGVSNKDNEADDYETSEALLRTCSAFIIVALVGLFNANRRDLVKELGWPDTRNLALQVVLVVCCYAMFMVVTRQLYDLIMLAIGFLEAPILLSPRQWGGFIPESGASLYDLDQAAAFAVGGVAPLVLSVKPLLKQVLARYRNRGARGAETVV